MHPQAHRKGAPGRLFCCLSFALLLGFHAAGIGADTLCPAQRIDERAQVQRVHDGDTLRLADGRKLRLIGIDTPERSRKGRPAQPFADEATQALRRLIDASGRRIGLQFGEQRHDRYQRLLAHVFDREGRNLNAALIRQGLAVAYTTPPNDRLSACYHRLDRQAGAAGAGFWNHPKYAIVDSEDILDAGEGFHRVRAHIRKLRFNSNGAWLYAGALAIHIRPADLAEFDLGWLTSYEGRAMILRGWLRRDRYQPASKRYLRLRHPDNIESGGHYMPR